MPFQCQRRLENLFVLPQNRQLRRMYDTIVTRIFYEAYVVNHDNLSRRATVAIPTRSCEA